MNTAALSSDPAGPFSLEFQFNDGSGTDDGNNTVTLDEFAFGAGGGAVGSPSVLGSVTGGVATAVSMTDGSFFNQFIQGFTPGSTLQFRVRSTTNVDLGGVPDEFTFSILDSSGTEIPTLAAFDVFLLMDIDSGRPALQSFASDTGRPTAAGGAPIDLSAPVVTAQASVPEPASIVLESAALIALALLRRRGTFLPRQQSPS